MKLRISAALWAVVGVSASYSGAEAFAFSTHHSGRGLLRRPLQLVQRQSNNENHRLMVTSSLSMSSSSSSSPSSTGPRDEIPSIDLDTASPQEVDALVQSEYDTWCQTWGKTPDKARYAIFQKNYLMQLRYDQQTGIYSGLNEFGDWTPEEYQQHQQQQQAPATAAAAAPAVSNQDDVVDDNAQDVDVREEYQTWGTENAKEYLSEERYEVFKANFLANQRYFEQTGKYYVLNEFADMTPDEYEAMVMAEGGGGMPEDNGSGLPSYMQGMTTPASAPPPSSSSQGGAGMPSFADSLSGGYSSNKPAKEASYMPKSYKPSSGSGMPSYFDNLGSSSNVPGTGTGSTSGYAPTIEPNLTPAGPSSGGAGAGMPSFADSLSGGYSSNKPAKEATYMPKSYKQSSGSGLPSYFDNLGSGGSGSGSGTGTSSSSSGSGLPSFADSLSGGGGGGGGGNQMKPSSYMPKSYKQSSGSGMPSYFDNLGSASDASSYSAPTPPPPPAPPAGVPEPPPVTSYSGADSYSSTSTSSAGPPSGAGMPSFADSLSGGGGGGQNKMKPSSYMPKSYKQSSGSGLPSYFDNMGQPGPAQQQQPQAPHPVQQAASAPPPGALEYKTTSPPPNIRPNIAPSNGIRSDQSAQLARIHSPARGGGPSPGHPLANPMTRPLPLKCDQTVIMREGDAFLPHAQDPVVKRGNLLPDQSNDQRYFFTGRLCATDSFQDIPMGRRFPSDQERVENQTRRTLMYFQKSNHRGRRPTAVAAGGGGRGPARTGAGPPTGAGMPSFADSLSGGNNSNRRGGAPQPVSKKPTNYMPKSYKKSSGSGMPSYFDNLDRPRGGGGSGTGRPQRNF